ncbi:dromaiocalcin-1-like [Panulirus ornatus]|uniref:dromaiocalcin-1-like n=1 Tax=Panulirus ornatus TaxID=150431 RepID=UPI003A85ADD3
MEHRSSADSSESGSRPSVTRGAGDYRGRPKDSGRRSHSRRAGVHLRECGSVGCCSSSSCSSFSSCWGGWAAVVVVVVLAAASRATPTLAKRNASSYRGQHANQVLSATACPIAFHAMGSKCYFYGYFPLNWFRAAEFCHSFGQDVSLAAIDTAQENYHIKRWLVVNGNHRTGVWVGGSDNGHNGKWAWFPTGQLVDYSNWGPSQPSGGDQHCMYMVGGLLGYQWADFHCDFEMNFLCEYRVNHIKPWR